MIPLSTAYLCFNCRTVLDKVPTGKCANCGSENIQPLGWLGRRRRDRVRWLRRIGMLSRGAKKKENLCRSTKLSI